ncbi:hypothetical protein F5Y17DRAFT_451656 [Xylariaceae sp. FL0594]|nr:hypothetical protein F5Y17DRAFT_451656 [Xylariaceae sp. FL0594]
MGASILDDDDGKPSIAFLSGSEMALALITILAFLIPAYMLLPPFPPRRSDFLISTHSKVGVRTRRGREETVGKRRAKKTGDDPTKPRVQSLHIYPVKSCRGIEVARSRVLPQGLEYDRLFTFAQLKSPFPLSLDSSEAEQTSHRWEFVTQRQFPLLATVEVDLWLPDDEKWRRHGQSRVAPPAYLVMRFPWREEGRRGKWAAFQHKLGRGWRAEPEKEIVVPLLDFPIPAEEMKKRGYVYEDVKIWKDTVTALNVSAELPEELRLYLGVSNKLGLFRVDPNKLREVFRCAPREKEAGYQPVTGFQDAYSLHMITTDSVEQFSKDVPKDEKLKELDRSRFRANIILSGAPAYDEESWKKARFRPGASELGNDAVFHVSCRTVRCKMPNVHPVTGERHAREPDRSLRALRAVDAGAPNMGCLGMQLTPLFFEDDDHDHDRGRSGSANEEKVKNAARSGLRGDDDDGDDDPYTWIAVGMEVDVEERGEHLYIKQ